MIKLSTNPVMFRIQYMNRDVIDTATNVKALIGKAFHKAFEVYYGGSDIAITDESCAIVEGLKAGTQLIEQYVEGFIKFDDRVPNKQKALEYFTFGFNSYIKERPYKPDVVIGTEVALKHSVDIDFNGQRLVTPVPFKGYIDKVEKEGEDIVLRDYKTSMTFSDEEKIDGAKMIQAVVYYFLAYAEYGKAPTKLYYDEVKLAKNKEGGEQVRTYCIVYKENALFFQFFLRFYEDMIKAMNGEMVFLPNVNTMYDNEVSMIAYIHGLDMPEELAEKKKKMRVKTITEVLRKEINSTANLKKLMATIEKNTILSTAIDYSKMKNEEKIATKLMEHGIIVRYDSQVVSSSIIQYLFTPSIGVKMSKLKAYAEDLEQVLGMSGVRVIAPVPNTSFIGVEIPRGDREFPRMPSAKIKKGQEIYIGQRIDGTDYTFDIRSAPHMLVAGATGSGKSVFLNNVIKQLTALPESELWLFDPKRVELTEMAHKARKYADTTEDITIGLRELVGVMYARYEAMKAKGVKKNEDLKNPEPTIYAVIDEFGELVKSKAIGESISTLSRMARASGIHLIIATQRPSVKTITGDIKANFPVKVAFRTAKAIDSEVVIDEAGAEKLLGKGDMLFSVDGASERLQGYSS